MYSGSSTAFLNPSRSTFRTSGGVPLAHGQAAPVEDRILDRIAGLGDGRHLGEERVSGRRHGCQDPDLLRLVELEHLVHAGSGHRDVPADQRRARRGRPVERNKRELQAVSRGQQGRGKVPGLARARMTHRDHAGIGLGIVHQFLQRLELGVRLHREACRAAVEEGDRGRSPCRKARQGRSSDRC